ncbi:MAG: hypothetical protein OEV76_01600 [Anaerolineae bacterium]|nr:hypothetical protein [Anaerolineae bacterium]
MRNVNRSWMALVAAALLLGALAGVIWAKPSDRPQSAEITRKVTLTGGDFIPARPESWDNSGQVVRCTSGRCFFNAPVVFPCLPSVTVERIKLHVRDDNGSSRAFADMYRDNPSRGAGNYLGYAASPEETSSGLKTYTSDPINKVVWPSQKASIRLDIGGPNIDVYGVTVEYHRNI